jgi:hypothetical protein
MNKLFGHVGQQYAILHPAKTKVIIAGRGWGKTTVDGCLSAQCINHLPRSRGFFLGLTYTQILTKFLPPITDFWERMGIKEHISAEEPGHYVVGIRPPAHFARPHAKIKKYTNVISFFNGSYIELLSMDRKDLNLGGSYDWGLLDEVQGIDRERFLKEYFIGLRGNIYKYDSPLHQTLVLTGTMPWLVSGQWLLEYEEKSKNDPRIMYLERPSYDNIDALGEDYFKKMRQELPAMMYSIEIENLRVNILQGGFYAEFREAKHIYYNSYDYTEISTGSGYQEYNPSANDYDPHVPIELSFDFNASITTILIAQEKNGEIRFIDMMYETDQQVMVTTANDDEPRNLLQRVLRKFISKYANHKALINIWGDASGHNRSDRSESSFEIVERSLRTAKLYFNNFVSKSVNPAHVMKYHVINDILAEKHPFNPKVRINMNTCKELIVSMTTSPVTPDYTKDKRSERMKNIPYERQTHFSDAFDYIVFGKYRDQFFAIAGGASISIGR